MDRPAIVAEGLVTRWTVHEWFLPGFAPYRVYCSWATGLYANIPMLFGMRAEVTKERIMNLLHPLSNPENPPRKPVPGPARRADCPDSTR